MKLHINGIEYQIELEPDTPLLWAIRDNLGLTGTKFGCGIAQCGPVRFILMAKQCVPVLPVSAAVGKKITTIEGLSKR